jgi:hypothetical protein
MDTTTHSATTFTRVKNAPLPPNFKKYCWDRSLQFYYNGQPIQAANETMKDIEIRFTYNPGEAQYQYTAVTIELATKNNRANDLENLVLIKNQLQFSNTFAHGIATAIPLDGTLQHAAEDSLIATFRNTRLLLDTMRVVIPFKLSKTISVEYAEYFDRNADGFIDSIPLTIKGAFAVADIDEFVQSLVLPGIRVFSITGKTLTAGGMALLVDQDRSTTPNTAVLPGETIIVNEKYLSNGGLVLARIVDIVDKAAPVIMKAKVLDFGSDSLYDSLTVEFSESVKQTLQKTPFYFKNTPSGKIYTAVLRFASLNPEENTATYSILSVKDLNDVTLPGIGKGDSIRINAEVKDNVSDKPGNQQTNPLNIRRVVSLMVLKRPFNFIIQATSPFTPGMSNPLPNFILAIPETKNYVEQHQFETGSDGSLQGILVAVKPDNPNNMTKDETLKGMISIFDVVGNKVISDAESGFYNVKGDKKNIGLYFAWNCRNKNSRLAGPGIYLVIVRFSRIDSDGGIVEKLVLKHFIGITKVIDYSRTKPWRE